jgi:hypothetical protein
MRTADASVNADGAPTRNRLVVPAGLLLDETSRERLEEQLRRAPADVVGVVAPVVALTPGASYRVQAEWAAFTPRSVAHQDRDGATAVRGSVLLRPGVEFSVADGAVDVQAALLIDPGAVTHDPAAPIGPLSTASEQGRPPFPRRPVVAFLACEPGSATAQWAQRMANRLVRRDVEARLLLAAPGSGLHLTRPALPSAESVRALEPDVIVTLDDAAASAAPGWCAANRATVLVEFVDDSSFTARLVPWRVGAARGRLRAQVTTRVETPTLVRLVHRLCAGPQPGPPTGVVPAPIPARDTADVQPATRLPVDCLVLHCRTRAVDTADAPDAAEAAERARGLVDHLGAAGVPVTEAKFGARRGDAARAAGLVVLLGAPPEHAEALVALAEARRRAGKQTVLDIDSADVAVAATPPTLSEAAASVAAACGRVTSPGGALHRAARAVARAHAMPTMLSRDGYGVLRRVSTPARPAPVIGWHLTGARSHRGLDEGLAKVLADRSDVHVHCIGDADAVPEPLQGHARVRVLEHMPAADELATWAVHVWTPRVVEDELLDGMLPFLEASTAAVPTVMTASARACIDGWMSHELVVEQPDDPDEWAARLLALLDDERHRAHRGAEARRRASALLAPTASLAAIERFLGWLSWERTP